MSYTYGDRVRYKEYEYKVGFTHPNGKMNLVRTVDGKMYHEQGVDPADVVLLESKVEEDLREKQEKLAETRARLQDLPSSPVLSADQVAERQDPYYHLRRVLSLAVDQASAGKGLERHAAQGERFEDQQIVQLGLWMGFDGSPHFNLGQATKKALEAARLSPLAAQHEILGAINYLAGAYLILEKQIKRD